MKNVDIIIIASCVAVALGVCGESRARGETGPNVATGDERADEFLGQLVLGETTMEEARTIVATGYPLELRYPLTIGRNFHGGTDERLVFLENPDPVMPPSRCTQYPLPATRISHPEFQAPWLYREPKATEGWTERRVKPLYVELDPEVGAPAPKRDEEPVARRELVLVFDAESEVLLYWILRVYPADAIAAAWDADSIALQLGENPTVIEYKYFYRGADPMFETAKYRGFRFEEAGLIYVQDAEGRLVSIAVLE